MLKFKNNFLAFFSLALGLILIVGCSAGQVMEKAGTANSAAVAVSAAKLCSTMSTIAVERDWDDDTIAARDLFCETWRE